MNKLFNHVSWNNYLTLVGLAGIACYAYIALQYYRKEITRFIQRVNGKYSETNDLPAVLIHPTAEEADAHPLVPPKFSEELKHKPVTFNGEMQELAKRLLAHIAAATGKPYAPAILITQLKHTLNDFPVVAASPGREDINAFIVRECEKTGTALLSESEVDMWWSA